MKLSIFEWVLICFVFGLILALNLGVSLSQAEPLKVSQEGPYRVSVDGELKKKKFGAYHKALTFAINKYLKCHCEVLILAPPIQVASLVPPLSTDDVVAGGEIGSGGITQTQQLSGADVEASGEISTGEIPDQDQDLDTGDIAADGEIGAGGIIQTQNLDAGDIASDGAIEGGGITTGPAPIIEYSVDDGWEKLDDSTQSRDWAMFRYTGSYETILWYCCAIDNEPHQPMVSGETLNLNFATFPPDDGGQRELYYDILHTDGSLQQSNFAYFALEPAVLHDVTVTWDAPTAREKNKCPDPPKDCIEENRPLPTNELAGYHVEYWSELDSSDVKTAYVQPGTVLELEIDGLQGSQKWFFRANAQDTTPDTKCPQPPDPPEEIPYSCGGPLISKWSETVTVEL